MAETKTKTKTPSAGELLATRERAARFKTVGKDAEVSRGVYVARGVSVNGDVPSLVVTSGDRQQAVPFAAVARAILSGVITDAEIETLRAARA